MSQRQLMAVAPPTPQSGWNRSVDRNPISIPPSIPYVMGQVMGAKRGAFGFNVQDNTFVLYLKVERADQLASYTLNEIEEIWVCVRKDVGK